jgi:hypothetical protein
MQDDQARFQAQVEECAVEIARALGALADRHSTLVVLAALSEQVGSGLLVCRETGACSAERVREILRRVEELTFTDQAGSR